jgi:polyhydroxyalkanoate synthesis regulator phasin
MSELVEVLMKRDELTKEEAEACVEEMRADVESGSDPEELLYDYGLEPDYVFDLLS